MRAPRAHLALRLRKGWSYDPSARCFRKEGCERVRPGADLPKYTLIRLQIPTLARKRDRTPEEDNLARGIQILLPPGSRLQTVLKRVGAWPCVEKVWIAPEPSAPLR
jgi:hypothetical protein